MPHRRRLKDARAVCVSLFFAVSSVASNEHTCRWSYNNLHWDLTPLIRHASTPDYALTRGAWRFDMNVCSNTNRIPTACKAEFGATARQAPGYQTLMKNGETACYYMGNVNTAVWGLLDENKPEDGVKLTYNAGTKCDGRTGRSMEYHFICDPQIDGPGEPVTVAGECRFMIIWQTKYACPTYPASSPLLALWGLLVLAVYLVAGSVYNVTANKMPLSLAAVPHAEGLLALALLCREGCVGRERKSAPQETTRLNPTADV